MLRELHLRQLEIRVVNLRFQQNRILVFQIHILDFQNILRSVFDNLIYGRRDNGFRFFEAVPRAIVEI